MKFFRHSDLAGKHAILGASQYHWINYDPEKIAQKYKSYIATLKGTELHDFAARCIRLKQKLPKSKKTLNQYVNDAIGFGMTPEQPLYYSENCFGTTDAISFRNDILRIHDFKSGIVPAHMEQLMIYAALFCLEYQVKPQKIQTILRIYQNDEYIECIPNPLEVKDIMDRIVESDKIIAKLKSEEE